MVWFASFFNFLLFGREGEDIISDRSSPSLVTQADKNETKNEFKEAEAEPTEEINTNVPEEKTKSVDDLIDNLIVAGDSEELKAYKIYCWVAKNIEYDDISYNSGGYSYLTPEEVLKNRLAVCDGYSELYKALAIAAGLDAKKLIGYDKGFSNQSGSVPAKPTHAWNAVKIDNKWVLLDVTWGSGYGTKTFGLLKTTQRFTKKWFNVNPESFLYTHLPVDSQSLDLDTKLQMVKNTIQTKKDFFEFPDISPQLTNLGFSPTKINALIKKKKTIRLVETFGTQSDDIKIIKAPYIYYLGKSKNYEFEIESQYYKKLMIVNDSDQTTVSKTGNNFRVSKTLKKGDLRIGLLADTTSKRYEVIMVYKVL